MPGLPPVFVEFLGKTTGVKTAMRDVKAELGAASAEGETSFSRFGRVSKAAIAGIGIAAGVVAFKTVKMASDFQAEMTKLSAAAGLTAGDLKKFGYTTDSLNQKILQIGNSVGVSGTEMAQALYHPISAGLNLEQSLNVVTEAAKESKISGAALEDTTYSLSSVMKAFNEPASQAAQAMANLNAIVGQGDMRFQDFNESVKNWAPTAAQMGISVNSMGAGIAYLTDRGNDAETAATRLTMGISMMTTPSAKASKMLIGLGVASSDVKASSASMQKAMKAAGITQNQLAADLKKPDGLYVALKDLRGGLKETGVTGTEADSVLAKIFGGGRSDKAIMSLMQNLDGLQTKYKDISKESTKAAFAASWEKTQKTFSTQMAMMKASLTNLGIAIGTKLLPYALKAVHAFAVFGSWLLKHRAFATALAVVIGGALVMAITAAGVALWGFLTSAEALEALPWVAAITAIIVVIVLLATHWRQVWGVIKSVSESVGHAVTAAWHWVASTTSKVWHSISSFVVGIWNSIAGFFSSAWHTVTDPIVKGWKWIRTATLIVWTMISNFFKKWWPLLLVIFAAPIALLIAVWNHFHTQIMNTVHAVWNLIMVHLKAVWMAIVFLAKTIWMMIQIAIIDPIKVVWSWLQMIWTQVHHWLSKKFGEIRTLALIMWVEIKDAIIKPIEKAWHSVVTYMTNLKNGLYAILMLAWDKVKNIARPFMTIGKNIVMGIIHGVENGAGALFGSLKNLANGALKAAKSFLGINSPSKLFAQVVGTAIPEGIAKGVDDNAHLAHNAVGDLAGGLSAHDVNLNTTLGMSPGLASGSVSGQFVLENTTIVQMDGEAIYKVVQKKSLRHDRRNLTNGLSLARG